MKYLYKSKSNAESHPQTNLVAIFLSGLLSALASSSAIYALSGSSSTSDDPIVVEAVESARPFKELKLYAYSGFFSGDQYYICTGYVKSKGARRKIIISDPEVGCISKETFRDGTVQSRIIGNMTIEHYLEVNYPGAELTSISRSPNSLGHREVKFKQYEDHVSSLTPDKYCVSPSNRETEIWIHSGYKDLEDNFYVCNNNAALKGMTINGNETLGCYTEHVGNNGKLIQQRLNTETIHEYLHSAFLGASLVRVTDELNDMGARKVLIKAGNFDDYKCHEMH
jgi:hypothetical protein